ncbi:MAG: tetratricopeptide repeat protein, partial [Anaerolineae bacterium]
YRATGQPQRALALYQEALPIMREVGDRAGESAGLAGMATLLYQHLDRPGEAVARMEQAIALLVETGLPQNAAGATVNQLQQALAAMQGGAPPGTASDSPDSISAQTIQAVRAFVNAEDWDATRRVVKAQQALLFQPQVETLFEQNIAQARAAGEQRIVEMLELHLALLRQCRSVGIEAAFAQLQAAPQGGSADPQLLSALANNTLAVLGPAAGQRDAWREGLLDLHRQATAQDAHPLLALLDAIIALLDANGDPSGLGQNLEGPYAQTWRAITKQRPP